jgi:hypothetical protein
MKNKIKLKVKRRSLLETMRSIAAIQRIVGITVPLAAVVGFSIVSCGNAGAGSDTTGTSSLPAGMYVAGFYNASSRSATSESGSDGTACYWVGNERRDLFTSGSKNNYPIWVVGIAVVNGKVYSAGTSQVSNDLSDLRAWYSINGVKTDLHPSGVEESRVFTTDVYGNKFYVAGGYRSGGKNIGCYWVDGERFNLADFEMNANGYLGNSFVYAMSIEGGKPYFAGIKSKGDIYHPFYWVDDKTTDFPHDLITGGSIYDSNITQLAVENGKVYASGAYDGNNLVGSDGTKYAGWRAYYWTQTKMIDLQPPSADFSWAQGIAVVNGDVWVLGEYGNWIDNGIYENFNYCYWVNDKLHNLKGAATRPKSMIVRNGKVYIVGIGFSNGGFSACVWIDGEQIFLNGDSAEAIAFAE